MAIRALIFGIDDLFSTLKPFYELEIQRGNLEIVGHAIIENGNITIHTEQPNIRGGGIKFSDSNNLFRQ